MMRRFFPKSRLGALAAGLFLVVPVYAQLPAQLPESNSELNDLKTEKNLEEQKEPPAVSVESKAQAPIPDTPVITQAHVTEESKALVAQGDKYLFGEGVAADPAKAAEFYEQASDAGNPLGMRRLAAMYRRGLGFPVNLIKAFEYVRQAASLNDPSAQTELAELYIKGEGVKKSRDKAKFWLEKASENHYILANVLLSELLTDGKSSVEDRNLGESYLKKAEEEATPQSLYTISYAYARGARLPKSETKAAYWARLAADKGEPNAAYWLGGFLLKSKSAPEAVKYFDQAADAGITESALAAGHLYKEGEEGLKADPVQAVKRLSQAEKLLDANDAFYLMHEYFLGPKEIRNPDLANKWLAVYADKADTPDLQTNSEIYWNGAGVRRNFDFGGALGFAALKKGDLSAACDYAFKLGTPNWRHSDYVTAYAILDQCSLDMPQEERWKKLRDELQQRMSPQQLQEAQVLDADEALVQHIEKKDLVF